jgi:TetR/AcrR family transcriptional regulator, repressor for neighboring sulfatase
MAQGEKPRRREGREQATAAILDAAAVLFAERGYTAVTVRDIAAEAGVSHALVHRYLGTKEQVYRATLARSETAIKDSAPTEGDLLEATRLMLREATLHQRRHVRLIAHSALHGLSFDQTGVRFPATERLLEIARGVAAAEGEGRDPDAPDADFVIASIVAMLIGWSTAREWLLQAVGLEMSDDEFVDQFERVVLDLERLYFPTLRDEPED